MKRRRTRRRAVVAAVVWTVASLSLAKVFLMQDEAIKLVFPGAVVERQTFFLTVSEQDLAAKLSGGDRPSALVVAYAATKQGLAVGTAYFDTHIVRTQPETLMVALDSQGAILRIEVLSFAEPEEYLPREHWYAQFPGRKLDDELAVQRAIRPVAGATLTVRATMEAVRRILAIHQVLHARATAPR